MSNRVINRVGARELTPGEVDQVYGGSRIPITSVFPPVIDGIITD